ncbi:hypothetical protein [Lacibacter sp. H407]|uniref:hypothetical protein n=1 Tax=Lacibacter sp. H407 TaxID=3133423 RepID=UPI0030C3BF30
MTKLLFLLLLLQHAFAQAAEQKYLLYNVNNDVHWVHDGKKEKAKRGMFLLASQSIILPQKAEVMLIQHDGQSLLLSKSGTYSFTRIQQLFSSSEKRSVSTAFFSYVFEKFLSNDDAEEKQKVSASVFRGKKAMQLPADSTFILSFPISLQWKPEQKNIPYKLTVHYKQIKIDTVLLSKNTFTLPESITADSTAALLSWTAIPSDSKQKPTFFLAIIPAVIDMDIIQQQLKQLRLAYSKQPDMLRLMEKDLFERWMELYQLQPPTEKLPAQ